MNVNRSRSQPSYLGPHQKSGLVTVPSTELSILVAVEMDSGAAFRQTQNVTHELFEIISKQHRQNGLR